MPRVPFYTPQIEVPVEQAPLVRPSTIGSDIAEGAARINDAVQISAKQDANVYTALETAKLKAKYVRRMEEAEANGEINEGWTGSLLDEFDEDMDDVRSRSPNAYASQNIELAYTSLHGDLEGRALGQETRFKVEKRSTDVLETIKQSSIGLTSKGQSYEDLTEAFENVDAAIRGALLPLNVRNNLLDARSQMADSWARAQAETNPQAIIDMLQSGHDVTKLLDPRSIPVIINQAQATLNRKDGDARVRRAELAEDAFQLANSDIASRKRTGKALTDPSLLETIKGGLTPRQYEKYESAVERADQFHRDFGEFKRLPRAAIDAKLRTLEPKGGEADYDARIDNLKEAQTEANALLRRRHADPMTEVRDAFDLVDTKWKFYEANQAKEHLRDAIKSGLAAQAELGLAENQQRPLPQGFAASIAQQISSAPPDKAYETLKGWADTLGPHWDQSYRQMAKALDPHARVAALMPDPAKAALLLSTARQGDVDQTGKRSFSTLEKSLDLPASGPSSVIGMIAQNSTMRDFRTAASQLGAEGAKFADDLYGAAKVMAYGLLQSRGVSSHGEAVQQAVDAVFSQKYALGYINSHPFYVPRLAEDGRTPRNVARIEENARAYQQSLTADGLNIGGPPGVAQKAIDAAVLASIKRNGYWVTNHDTSGVYLFSGSDGRVLLKNGNPIQLKWGELEQQRILKVPVK